MVRQSQDLKQSHRHTVCVVAIRPDIDAIAKTARAIAITEPVHSPVGRIVIFIIGNHGVQVAVLVHIDQNYFLGLVGFPIDRPTRLEGAIAVAQTNLIGLKSRASLDFERAHLRMRPLH